MVANKKLDTNECIAVVKDYFDKHFENFTLSKEGSYTGYWWVEYINQNDKLIVYFDGDIGGHFSVKITIEKTEYNLWQFDKVVNETSLSTKENIIYQLNVLKRFLTGL